jgi:hypothetical protein
MHVNTIPLTAIELIQFSLSKLRPAVPASDKWAEARQEIDPRGTFGKHGNLLQVQSLDTRVQALCR